MSLFFRLIDGVEGLIAKSCKAGAIIPMQTDMPYFGEKPVDPLTLDIYPSGNSSFKLYEDDGKTLKYQQGEFAQTEITCNENRKTIKIEIGASEGEFQVADRNYTLLVHMDNKPASVLLGTQIFKDWEYEEQGQTLELNFHKKAKEKLSVGINR